MGEGSSAATGRGPSLRIPEEALPAAGSAFWAPPHPDTPTPDPVAAAVVAAAPVVVAWELRRIAARVQGDAGQLRRELRERAEELDPWWGVGDG